MRLEFGQKRCSLRREDLHLGLPRSRIWASNMRTVQTPRIHNYNVLHRRAVLTDRKQQTPTVATELPHQGVPRCRLTVRVSFELILAGEDGELCLGVS